MIVLGLDPGTRKCGYAALEAGGERLGMGIVPIDAFPEHLARLARTWPVDLVAIGAGTASAAAVRAVEALGLRYELIDEHETSLLARSRFFDDHPPRGWRRFVPRGMLLPDRPIDDYAALLIAERFLRSTG